VADDLQICHDESGDVAIAACTRAIESGRLSKRNLAVAYTSRGVEWRAKGEVDRAIIDHSDAIRTDPTVPESFYNRGNAYKQKGNLDQAIADYTQAIRINPKDASAYNNRGNAYSDKGDTARANADYAQAKRLKP
jgi:tetratricopeptide (TPR) repeat protein